MGRGGVPLNIIGVVELVVAASYYHLVRRVQCGKRAQYSNKQVKFNISDNMFDLVISNQEESVRLVAGPPT